MKKFFYPTLLASLAIIPLTANAKQTPNQQKISVVKKVYQNLDQRQDIISNNASPTLKLTLDHDIASTPADGIPCQDWGYIGGQDPIIRNIKYTVLKNGNVRATFKNHGQTEYNDFQFKQVNGKYLINDIWASDTSLSFLQDIKYCQEHGLNLAENIFGDI